MPVVHVLVLGRRQEHALRVLPVVGLPVSTQTPDDQKNGVE